MSSVYGSRAENQGSSATFGVEQCRVCTSGPPYKTVKQLQTALSGSKLLLNDLKWLVFNNDRFCKSEGALLFVTY